MNPKTETPPEDEEDLLHSGIRRLVLSRETVPRTPRWSRAFRRTLLRLARTLRDAEARRQMPEDTTNPPSEEHNDDQR
ncbi:MAG: hypothetical protein QHH80_02755 [Anaerolineae bacterium]|nr:hypothetical protein [Anaerolineae bacterium]